MTTLVLDELKTTLEQNITIDLKRRYDVAAIRPYIYMHNAPAGIFTLSIKTDTETLASQDFTSAEIKTDLSTSDNYAHIWKVIQFNDPVFLLDDDYILELSSSGYTFSESAYVGWIKEHESQFNDTSFTGLYDIDRPFSFQIFEHKRRNYHE